MAPWSHPRLGSVGAAETLGEELAELQDAGLQLVGADGGRWGRAGEVIVRPLPRVVQRGSSPRATCQGKGQRFFFYGNRPFSRTYMLNIYLHACIIVTWYVVFKYHRVLEIHDNVNFSPGLLPRLIIFIKCFYWPHPQGYNLCYERHTHFWMRNRLALQNLSSVTYQMADSGFHQKEKKHLFHTEYKWVQLIFKQSMPSE